jgi:hypothetical protein
MTRFRIIVIIVALVIFGAADSHAVIFGIRYSNLTQNPLPGNSLLIIGADYDRYKLERGDSLLYSRRLVVDAGYRYYLLPADKAKAMEINPFVAGHLFKSFSRVTADSSVLAPADVQYYKDLSNDIGGWVSLGAEYHFAPAFSFGGETGLRYSRAKSKAYGHDIKLGQYTSFVALIMTFSW